MILNVALLILIMNWVWWIMNYFVLSLQVINCVSKKQQNYGRY